MTAITMSAELEEDAVLPIVPVNEMAGVKFDYIGEPLDTIIVNTIFIKTIPREDWRNPEPVETIRRITRDFLSCK